MFLVECSELNETLVNICKSLITKILNKTEEFVYVETATKLQQDIRTMSTTFTQKAETSSELVISEKYLDDQKNIKRTEMIHSYLDLVDWLMMFHKQPLIDITEENIKNVWQAYQQTNKIQTSIDSQEVSLKSQRDEIEKKLLLETRTFFEELNEVKN